MPEPLSLLVDRIDSPVGELAIVADLQYRLRGVLWTEDDASLQRQLRRYYGDVRLERQSNPGGLTAALDAYFSGDVHAIDRLPVMPQGTPFQMAVWTALRDIPCGETMSYSQLAARIGHPTAVRAVGLANGANPIAIVLPCHRVIGANGLLTGYGGGLDRKRWLLEHEALHSGRQLPLLSATAEPMLANRRVQTV